MSATQPASAAGSGAAAARGDRDRFVALAFCWADLLLELDKTERVVFAAGPTEALFGSTPDALKGRPIADLIAERDISTVRCLLEIARKQGRFEQTNVQLRGPHGASPPLSLAGYRLSDMGGHYYLALRLGGASRRRTGAEGQRLDRDADSGLYDADSFSAVIADTLRASQENTELTMIALPGFEQMRQRMSREAEESFLSALGTTLRAGSIDGDSAARVGDERFVVLHGASVDALTLQQQITGRAKDADPAGRGVRVETGSIDIDRKGISDADLANGLIYTINRFRSAQGSDFNIKSLSTSLSSLVTEAVRAVQTFRQVVATRSFDVALQPIIDVRNGDIHHYEALCRFTASDAGQSPYQHITFAEETGLISDFDLAMATKVVQWLGKIPRQQKVSVAVNLSGNSVASLTYIAGLHALLKANPWTRDRLVFEITESARMEDLTAANRFIQGLRGEGYEVCLDDFGAGAANFQYLSTLEVDVVKIDGSAVQNAQKAVKGEAFFKALMSLCGNLGVATIAEMIDDKKGLAFVRNCGVDYVQGYLFGKPSLDIRSFDDTRPDNLFPERRKR